MLREIEKSGVLVLPVPINLSKKDAFTLLCDRVHMHVIVLSDGRTGERIRQSSARELGHIVLKHPKVLNQNEERQADDFAAELLLPEATMRREMIAPITLSVLCSLKSRWRVSIQALIRRGKELGIIDDSRARYLDTQLSVKGWREHEPAEVPVERPRLVRQLAERRYGKNPGALAEELGYQIQFVKEILNQYEGCQVGQPSVTAVRRR
jgi:Zn-dependent peptidase ImmA (M78 family)